MNYITGYARTCSGTHSGLNPDNLCINRHIKRQDAAEECYDFLEKQDTLIGLFDGGRSEGWGDMASFIAAKTLARFDGHLPREGLEMILHDLNHRIHDYAEHFRLEKPDTSSVILSIQDDAVEACMLGCCSLYHYTEETLQKVQGEVSIPQFRPEPGFGRKRPPRAPSGRMPEPLPLSRSSFLLKEKDLLLLCSDGVTDVVSEAEMEKILAGGNCRQIADSLIEQARKNGSTDSITVIVLTCEEKESRLSRFFR